MSGFLSKLTGSYQEEGQNNEKDFDSEIQYDMEEMLEDVSEENLAVDLYEDEDNLYIKTFVPAIEPKDIDIDLSRDTVTISGEKNDYSVQEGVDYFQKELSWGKFSKRVLLPKEIDIESAKASIKNGLLTLKLPKLDKDRKIKISLS